MTGKTRPALAFLLGLLILALTMVPSLLLGDRAYIRPHDQLDGEIPAYVLQARHLGDADIPEFLSGENNKATLTPASPGSLLFYLVASPATAGVLHECFIRLIAFLGLYLLLRRCRVFSWISALSALLFTLLPLYPVYGLAVMGQPLLWFAVLSAREGRKFWPYLLGAVFAAFSSPVLVGYADCLLLAGLWIADLIRRRRRAWTSLLMLAVLGAVYLALNRDLVRQLFGGGFVSHRTEWVLTPDNWWETVKTMFNDGDYHAAAVQGPFTGWVLAACAVGVLFPQVNRGPGRLPLRRLWQATALAAGIAVIYATWRSGAMLGIRQAIGGLFVYFRFERFFWLTPLCWWSAIPLTAHLLYSHTEAHTEGRSFCVNTEARSFYPDRDDRLPVSAGGFRGWKPGSDEQQGSNPALPGSSASGEKHKRTVPLCGSRLCAGMLCAVLLCVLTIHVVEESPLKENIRRLSEGVAETDNTAYRTFVSEELFQEIEEAIGRPKDSYKVASVGLYPSVPLLNGFCCIDGYSNNYDVEYKHAFREIIAGELAKKKNIRTYFDDWGNRCYIFSAELGRNYFFPKDEDTKIKKLKLNPEALKALGCEYIFAGVEISKPGDIGLSLLGEFERDGSPYRIWVYQVTSGDQ